MPDAHAPRSTGAAARWPLPPLDGDADKEAAAACWCIAGSREMPGAAVLAATAALRVGAGKLVIATAASAAQHDGARDAGGARDRVARRRRRRPRPAPAPALLDAAPAPRDAVLIGPGLMDRERPALSCTRCCRCCADRTVVLDALAMDARAAGRAASTQPVLLTPHAGEMAHLTRRGQGGRAGRSGRRCARRRARAGTRWSRSRARARCIAAPDGRPVDARGRQRRAWRPRARATRWPAPSPGLAARGATLEQACAWGVVLHAQAGERLARRLGPVGYLAREIAAEMVAVLGATSTPRRASRLRQAQPGTGDAALRPPLPLIRQLPRF